MPLYEAKLLGHFDHRFSTYRGATQAQLNVGSLPRLSEKEHDDPDEEALARYWVKRSDVAAKLEDRWDRDWLLGWRRIARTTDSRTFVSSVLPAAATGDSSSRRSQPTHLRRTSFTPPGRAWRSTT